MVMTVYRELIAGDCIVLYYGHHYHSTNRVPAGALDWAYETFPQDPNIEQHRVCYILGNLMFAYEEDYMQYRLAWL